MVRSRKSTGEAEAVRAELRARLRGAGLRATTSRVAVLETLDQASGPLSHAEVAEALGGGGWDRATIYRNLVDLADAEVLRRTTVGHAWRFEGASPKDGPLGHPHFVCTKCGAVTCVGPVEISVEESPSVPRSVLKHEVEIQLHGVCDECG